MPGSSRALRFAAAAAACLGPSVGLAAACAPEAATPRSVPAAAAPAETSATGAGLDEAALARAYAEAAALPDLRSLLVEARGRLVGEAYFHGATRDTPANVKSVSKSILSALVGIAIAEGRLPGVDATLAELLPEQTRGAAPWARAVTVSDLLTMRAGLESTSFQRYGRWVASRDWVEYALARPRVAARGTEMIYSTGNTHLLSAVLTRATGMSTLEYARRRLAAPLGIRLRPWTRDPQGLFLGGNDMVLTPRELLAFGRLYLREGRGPGGAQIVPQEWVRQSWQARTRSPRSGFDYGYGWWIARARGHVACFAWGFGGQFVVIVPALELVVVATSATGPGGRDPYHPGAVLRLVADGVVPAAGG